MMSAQNAQGPQIPIVLLKEGTTENKGKDAQRNNIAAAKQVANMVRSCLGPRGMDKMLVSSIGDAKITIKVDVEDKELLKKIARTSMYSKLVSEDSPILGQIAVDATRQVEVKVDDDSLSVDLDNIKVEKKAGGSIHDTKLIKGMVLDKEVVHTGMPKRIEKAKIALINSALEIEKTEMSAEIRINDPRQMQRFLDEENKMLKSMVDKIKTAGANVVICEKGIDDMVQHYLASSAILAVRRTKESDMFKLAKATGAKVVNNLDALDAKDLGTADLVEERKIETDKWVFIEGCKNPKAVTILVR